MQELFANGRIVDIVLGLMAAEALLLATLQRVSGYGPGLRPLLPNLLAGAFLLLALREALVGAAWHVPALWLTAALAAHAWDLRQRWPAPLRPPASAPDTANARRADANSFGE